jgi:transaldolase
LVWVFCFASHATSQRRATHRVEKSQAPARGAVGREHVGRDRHMASRLLPLADMGSANLLVELAGLGASPWMDFIRRDAITSGRLAGWIADGLRGVTSNPTIFEAAISGGREYDEDIRALGERGETAIAIVDALVVRDIQLAADLLRPCYDRLDGRDGFVSIEVSPRLAHDTAGTVAHARALWATVARPNAMIKVPATLAGLPAITQLVGDGINVNVTLLFGLRRYAAVVDAYLAGLTARHDAGAAIGHIASVASFFLSRIDATVDAELVARGGDALALRGRAAVACARLAYQDFESAFGDRFARLAAAGARPQRLLWASTSTTDPTYDDLMYVEALIGRDTVTTMPVATFAAFADHGTVAPTLGNGVAEARRVVRRLGELGVDLDGVADQLEGDGVAKFERSYDRLLQIVDQRRLLLTGSGRVRIARG